MAVVGVGLFLLVLFTVFIPASCRMNDPFGGPRLPDGADLPQ